MDGDSYYLSGYLDSLSSLPDDVKKTFAKMLELDTKNAEITKEIDAISEAYKTDFKGLFLSKDNCSLKPTEQLGSNLTFPMILISNS